MAPKRKNWEYYAVISTRLDKPTIFSSWGEAHPRWNGCSKATVKGFVTIQEARDYMKTRGITDPKVLVNDSLLITTPVVNNYAYYAIAHGKNPGIREVCGSEGALPEIDEIKGACFKRFRTKEQAEAFIEDWKKAYADVWARAIKQALDDGLKPKDMTIDTKGILRETWHDADIEKISQQLAAL